MKRDHDSENDRALREALLFLLRKERDPAKTIELFRALDEIRIREERRKVSLAFERKRKSAA